MATFLVDYENVNAKGLEGVDLLKESDRVFLFYSDRSNTLTFSLHDRINSSAASITFMNVNVGEKNSLDFQLSTYLGWLAAKTEGEDYVIVSKDRGYNSIVSFWTGKGVSVLMANNLMRETQKGIEKRLLELLPQFKDEIPTIASFLDKYKTKQGFNNALNKQYGNDKTSVIYKAVKPLLGDKKGK